MTEQTKLDIRNIWLPIGLVASMLATIIAIVSWMTSLYTTVQWQTTEINSLSSAQPDLIDRIARMETKIDFLVGNKIAHSNEHPVSITDLLSQ